MGYTLTSNSPAVGSIAWAGLTIVHRGIAYRVADGNTANEFVYWDKAAPTRLQSSASEPALGADALLVFWNDSGTGSSYLPRDVLGDTARARDAQRPPEPDGVALGSRINPDGSASVKVAWDWTGDESSISGFAVTFRDDVPNVAAIANEFFR
jgi:hypothetical protein